MNTSMPTPAFNKLALLKPFLSYLLHHRLDELTLLQVGLLEKYEHPVLRVFQGMSQEELVLFNKQAIVDLFTKILQDASVEPIDEYILNVLSEYFSGVEETVIIESISIINHIRRRTFSQFLPDFCQDDVHQMHQLLEELDDFLLASQLRSSEAYIRTLKNRIKEKNHFIQKLNQAFPSLIYVYDIPLKKLVYTNKNAGEVLGYPPQVLTQLNAEALEQLGHPDDTESLFTHKRLLKLLAVTGAAQYHCRYRGKEANRWRWLMTREVPFKKDSDGNIVQVLGTALEITAHKETEQRLLQKTVLLQNANASLEEFTYIASHDLKEPLRKIMLAGDLLVSRSPNVNAEELKQGNKIVSYAKHMHAMLQELLTLSLVNGNTAFEKCDLSEVFNQAVKALRLEIEQSNAKILSSQLPAVMAIPEQIKQVFVHLLSNSIKFRKEGVRPVIHVEHEYIMAGEMSYYGVTTSDKYVKIACIDNGIGFNDTYAAKIFSPFQRLHAREHYEGLGMGLTLCKKIIEHHGGHIMATGLPENGTIFTILLPAGVGAEGLIVEGCSLMEDR